jgi:DNA-binding response OmpR family regulator
MADNQIKMAAQEAKIASRPIRILCVDDELFNLDILEKHLVKAGYDTVRATDGQQAMDILRKPDHEVNMVLLDRMMPNLDGMEVLRLIKRDPVISSLPVIMQTAMAGADEAVEGIEAGAYYYITKPYEAQVLLSVVEAAAREFKERGVLQTKLDKADAVLSHATSGQYEFSRLKEGREVAAFLANFANDASKAIVALTALMTNAIEHGNLGIGYELKNELLRSGGYEKEFLKRSKSDFYKHRTVLVEFKKEAGAVRVYITDQGKGFDWKDFIDFDPSRMTEPNGRGIALANSTNPGSIQFLEDGHKVCYTIN